jgi:hypothetical protein
VQRRYTKHNRNNNALTSTHSASEKKGTSKIVLIANNEPSPTSKIKTDLKTNNKNPRRGGITYRALPWKAQGYQGNCPDAGMAVPSRLATAYAYKPKDIKTDLKINKKAHPGIEPKS